jgi:DNA modification methylase
VAGVRCLQRRVAGGAAEVSPTWGNTSLRGTQPEPALLVHLLSELSLIEDCYTIPSVRDLPNPKRPLHTARGTAAWYPYYAGFSPEFVRAALETQTASSAIVLDPWNGAGTTTSVAEASGFKSVGTDLNPAMVVVAKARVLSPGVWESLIPIASDICRIHRDHRACDVDSDPLLDWFVPSSAMSFRGLEQAVHTVLIGRPLALGVDVGNGFSELAAFFYLAMFRVGRSLVSSLQSSNPTWVRLPRTRSARLRPSGKRIRDAFKGEVKTMVQQLRDSVQNRAPKLASSLARIELADSRSIPLEQNSVDLVITSPPYCTRIDYAVATRCELSILRHARQNGFDSLRRSLLGTTSVGGESKIENLPDDCARLVRNVELHPSKGSSNYYWKTYANYFSGMQLSMVELKRVMKSSASALVVVQDSYYKEMHIDLPRLIGELAEAAGLHLKDRKDFRVNRSMARINRASEKFGHRDQGIESVLHLVA